MHVSGQEPIVAFTLAHYPKRAGVSGLAHLALDRWYLARTPGLHFWRLLGAGSDHAFDARANLQRYALFTVWNSLSALKRFEMQSLIIRRIHQRSDEVWTVHMRPVRWHGAWGGHDPFAGMTAVAAPEPGPWVILTHSIMRLSHLRAYVSYVPAVAEHLLQQPELINSVGIGEAPLLYQGTLSLWHSLPAMTTFAYGSAPHAEVMRRARREQWYREEFFARFCPVASMGTWDGTNPLPGLQDS